MHRCKLFFCVAFFIPSLTLASNIFETQDLLLALPTGWVFHDSSSAHGPKKETLYVSRASYGHDGPGDPKDLARLRKYSEKEAQRVLRMDESHPGLAVEAALSCSVPSPGVVVYEIIYRHRETGERDVRFIAVGPRTSVLVIARIPKENISSLIEIRKSVRQIVWAPSSK
jgi:hypothetical protein